MALNPEESMQQTESKKDVASIEQFENMPGGQPSSNQGDHTKGVGNALLVADDGTVYKIPVPSEDPNDPLRLARWLKMSIIFCCCLFSIMSFSLSGGLGTILATFFAIYIPQGKTAEQVVYLLTYPALFIGIGNFVILPATLWLGRRPTFLLSNLALLVATLGAAVNTSYQGHMTARIFQGLATGATESLLPMILTDVTFLHERSTVFGWYWAAQAVISSALIIACSYQAASLSWRWYYGIYVIITGVGLVLVFFLSPETRFRRSATSINGQFVQTDAFGNTRILTDEEARHHLVQEDQIRDSDIPLKSYAQMLNPWSGLTPNGGKLVAHSYLHMVEALSSPGLVYALLIASVALGCIIAVSQSYNIILETNFGWSPASVGLIYVGPIIGSLISMIYAGYLGDISTIWLAKRNNGVHTPEHRLPILFPSSIIGIAGLVLYGLTTEATHWAGVVVGFAMIYFYFISILIVTTTFAAEAWPKNPGPSIVLVVGAKNIIAFGLSYNFTAWTAQYGYPVCFGVTAAIVGAVTLLGIPVYIFNPMWRRYVEKREKQRKEAAQRASTA